MKLPRKSDRVQPNQYIHYRFRVQPTLREREETLTFTRAELEKCFAEWLAELVRSGRVTVNDATLSAPRE